MWRNRTYIKCNIYIVQGKRVGEGKRDDGIWYR